MQEFDGADEDLGATVLALKDYLRSICPVLMPIKGGGGEIFDDLLATEEATDSLHKFVSISENEALYVVASDSFEDRDILNLSLRAQSVVDGAYSVAFIKNRPGMIHSRFPLTTQLQMITLPFSTGGSDGKATLSILQQYLRNTFVPMIRLKNSRGAGTEDPLETENQANVQRKMREVELALEQCFLGTSIPVARLPVPIEIMEKSKATTSAVLKGYIEKFNSSQVGQILKDINLTLGETADQQEAFANEVNAATKQWPSEIKRQAALIKSSFPGSAEKEVNFWRELDKKMAETKAELESSPCLLTKLVLKHKNRVAEQLIKEAEAELDKSIEVAQVSVTFLRDFPVEDVLAASSLQPQLARAVSQALQHFSKIRHVNYDLSRALSLLEMLGGLVGNKLLGMLRDKGIMNCPMIEFRKTMDEANAVFISWDSHYATQRQVLVEVGKRRHEKLKIAVLEHKELRHRLKLISDFREQHDKLVNILAVVLSDEENDIATELSEAYKIFLKSNSDVLDISVDGDSAWSIGNQMYEKRLEKTEERITRLLSDKLESAKSADEMFRVFATFNPLFFRPAIRHAVNSFRNALVKNVREDVKRLQEKFKFRYEESQERATAHLRGIPPLSGRIVWARQIENQLTMLMKRIEDVLGAGWEAHFEGRQLKEVCDELRGYLNPEKLYKTWRDEQLKTDYRAYNRLKEFILLVDEDPISMKKFIRVNFEASHAELFKEVKYLDWLLPSLSSSTNSIPATIRSIAKEAYSRYPVAVALQAALSSFYDAKRNMSETNAVLLNSYIEPVREVINEAMGGTKRAQRWIKWDSTDLNEWVSRISIRVSDYQDRVNDINEKVFKVESLLRRLETAPYERQILETIMADLQTVVDEMQRKNFSNVAIWISQLDKKVETIICNRLKVAIDNWLKAFVRNEASDGLTERLETVYEIILNNQVLVLSPPIEQARVDWQHNFHEFLSLVATLPRIVSSRFVVFGSFTGPKDYSNAINLVDSGILKKVYSTIEDHLSQASDYIQKWLQYQALWDVSVGTVADRLGRNILQWQQLLGEIKSARSTIESSYEEKAFGPIVIRYQQVQNKINHRYEMWQNEIQNRFAGILADEIKTLHAELIACKTRLEGIYLEGPTKDVIIGVEFILKTKNSFSATQKRVSDLDVSERLLQRQRFKFGPEWMSASNITGAVSDIGQILERRSKALDAQLPVLQHKIQEEDKFISQKTTEFSASWEARRPLDGKLAPTEALQIIAIFQEQIGKLLESISRLRGAKTALGITVVVDDAIANFNEEISGLRDAWQAALPIWEKFETLRASPMKGIVPIKVRKHIEELNDNIRSVPSRIRSYSCVEHLQDSLNKCNSMQSVLKDLSSDALKERHWKILAKTLAISASLSNLSLGSVWDSNVLASKKVISEVLSVAQGELALEQFLQDIRKNWQDAELTLIVRDNSRVISGWDGLFGMLEDHLSSLSSLKQSPYFRNVPEFQEETNNWEGRLTTLRSIFEVWVEVQRKWLYLRGIFKSPDIKAQLPAQYTRFKGVDNEFSGLMKKVSLKPGVLDLLQIDNLCRLLERQDSSMGTVQKALGEYLEKQRQIFPRFYFVNNDDLVEIIGNSNEPTKIFPYFIKMFAAINAVQLVMKSESSTEAVAMISREGELVQLSVPVDASGGVKEWLTELQHGMIKTLAETLDRAVANIPSDLDHLISWVSEFPAQVVILSCQVAWCDMIESSLQSSEADISTVLQSTTMLLESKLKVLSEGVLMDLENSLRKKCEQLITEIVHERDVTRALCSSGLTQKSNFSWLYHLRFYWSQKETDLMKKLCIKISNASFYYGFEYLGIGERLVQTPLTDRCYLTLTQALHFGMGGNPFGPAGTGKTESVKMLGSELGRYVLVFNCDENFDYAAMGRIFSGLCQVGAWGCFDEFNRLEERILSAVSQQILTIQKGLMAKVDQIDLMGHSCRLHKDVGIFVTMNPGYAGRSNLPDNLKLLFRSVAMSTPDRRMIAQVMLFSQGIITAESLAGKITLLFTLCEEQLSFQSHYDFGLRALKSVLVGAGELKRKTLVNLASKSFALIDVEKDVLIRSTCNSVLPKLVADDISLFLSLLQGVFPDTTLSDVNEPLMLEAIKAICVEDMLEYETQWVEKILQLKQVLEMRHGVMMVGKPGTGKSSSWRTLLKALHRVDGIKGDFYIIDPKTVKKDKLYGSLDPNTLEWTDGIFTKILRKIVDNAQVRGNVVPRRSWIIFDGDVDPEWAENLNSVLDDNKILTLPSGDRLKIPADVRIMMEVDSLKHATLATVSRCGMVWFPENLLSIGMILRQMLNRLKRQAIALKQSIALENVPASSLDTPENNDTFVDTLSLYFTSSQCIVELMLQFALQQQHVMEPTSGLLLESLYSLLVRGLVQIVEYNETNTDFPMSNMQIECFASKWLVFSLLWGFGGSMNCETRVLLSAALMRHTHVDIPAGSNIIDYQVTLPEGSWAEWSMSVPKTEIDPHRVTASDVIVMTSDTVRHAEVLRAWLTTRNPLILCGPPGSGKTMTLTSFIEANSEYVLASLNFSSGTTPDLIIKTFSQYCEIVDSPEGPVMQPSRNSYSDSKWLVVFCDEVNLPTPDKYGTQRVVMFLRQLVEQGGFWNNDCRWIRLRRIQFICACNPPTDAGREVMTSRFLRHAPILLVDYPAQASLKLIYKCFNTGLLKLQSNLKGSVDALTSAMVEFYFRNQEKFTADIAPQYIYSPRELTRWVRALHEAIEPMESVTMEELVRLWAHEGLRLFHDRLISKSDKKWCEELVDKVAERHFPGVDMSVCLQRPMLYSNWIKKRYEPVNREELSSFISARLNIFYEEELDVPLVVFDDVLEHVLRIDNVLRHPMGHLLLVGESGVGKTVLTRFVAWINGLTVFQIKANRNYSLEQFDEDLRSLMRRVAVDNEKICFIFDESNVLSSAFLERMNALLASGEVPGLFEGDELVQLLSSCRDSFSQRDGHMLEMDSDMIWRRFTKAVQNNLHVVFTMNPASSDFQNRCTTSPALFNRCVVDWFGTWSPVALAQVASEFTKYLDIGFTEFNHNGQAKGTLAMVIEALGHLGYTLREAVVAALVSMHDSVKMATVLVAKSSGHGQHYISPRDFLDLINKFVALEAEKRSMLQDQQTHIRTGLQKLLETQEQVSTLRQEMVAKETILRSKDDDANKKLTRMVENQNAAENAKTLAEQLTIELRKQESEIQVRKAEAEQELSEAEPALLAAKQCVQGIKKAQMDEVRGLARPPNAVRLTMEMVCVMIGEKSLDWEEIRKAIRSDDFISRVVNFDPTTITQKQSKKVQEEYLSNSEMDYAKVDRASKACGPLYQWAESQINYCAILRRIKPLRDEVEKLQIASESLVIKQSEAVSQVEELEKAINQIKVEYAAAIRETEIIRTEMIVVKKKVDRAESLLQSLDKEKDRWIATSNGFDMQMSTLIGDCLLSAAFLTYGGIFDHTIRKKLLTQWSFDVLSELNIPFRPEMDLIEYLSKPSDLLAWKGYGLASDELAVQNAILLERFNRFPFVIDPSGHAHDYIMQKFASKKITTTSFLDPSFMKTLASAIRFGTPLLINDAESVDPILNPILNKELQKMGGRTLIRLGSEDIDFSPKFLMILMTRNPLVRLSPDLCSRVTLINFTVTPASLESQSLTAILKSERADVDVRRSEALRLQSEQNVRIRELEESLLDKISAVQGAILDDDTVINTLENIQREAADLNQEVMKTEEIMNEVKSISCFYEPLASSMSSIYFSIEKLADVNFLYQFNLQFFLELIAKVLKSANSGSAVDKQKRSDDQRTIKARVNELTVMFFKEVFRQVLRALKFEDKFLFAARLAQIFMIGEGKTGLNAKELDALLNDTATMSSTSDATVVTRIREAFGPLVLDEKLLQKLVALVSISTFTSMISHISSNASTWVAFIESLEPELCVPVGWLPSIEHNCSPERQALLNAVVVRCLRPDRIVAAIDVFVSIVFNSSVQWKGYLDVDLVDMFETDSRCSKPIMLCSEAGRGQDASGRVEVIAQSSGKTLLQVAMGSSEGYTEADKFISQAAKMGQWVLLRNTHLCTEWLGKLEKRLQNISPHNSFRLILTCEITPLLPTSLLRTAEVVFVEASTGIKANLSYFMQSIPAVRFLKPPVERGRLYLFLAWLNAVVHERLRYVPLGWSKRYEFNEADSICALDVIDQWVDSVSLGKSHIDPNDLPWQALRTLLSESFYGGRVDNCYDQAALDSFIESIFSPSSYESAAPIALEYSCDYTSSPTTLLTFPDGFSRSAFESWINSLPDNASPAFLGLPAFAENHLQSIAGNQLLSRLSMLMDDDIGQLLLTQESSDTEMDHPVYDGAHLNTIVESLRQLRSTLPSDDWVSALVSYAGENSASDVRASSLGRAVTREIAKGLSVLQVVLKDVANMKSFCEGSIKTTNIIRDLLSNFAKNSVPLRWKNELPSTSAVSLSAWVADLSSRCGFLLEYFGRVPPVGKVLVTAIPRDQSYWLGGMFFPEAFITATRQLTAKVNSWSLEELELYLEIGVSTVEHDTDIILRGLFFESAGWIDGSITLSSDLRQRLPLSRLRWQQRDRVLSSNLTTVSVPVYLSELRKSLVLEVKLLLSGAAPPAAALYRRGVAIILR